ncbi:hypothetical protein B9Z19DRAFT_1136602 [Tuber borchii]|uniref:SAM domain-containing protein n=1 Tax=Tuber borchii TaxID=42251 RepID=A0A2T6ZBF5_TUBBO|nr:hypothetical protein B9Z19DRAFT_1136602 [Tuber borchii]
MDAILTEFDLGTEWDELVLESDQLASSVPSTPLIEDPVPLSLVVNLDDYPSPYIAPVNTTGFPSYALSNINLGDQEAVNTPENRLISHHDQGLGLPAIINSILLISKPNDTLKSIPTITQTQISSNALPERKLQVYLQYTPTGSTEQLTKAMELSLPLVWKTVLGVASQILQRPHLQIHLKSKLSSQKKSDPWTTFDNEEDAKNLTSTIRDLLVPRGGGKPQTVDIWFHVSLHMTENNGSIEGDQISQQQSRKRKVAIGTDTISAGKEKEKIAKKSKEEVEQERHEEELQASMKYISEANACERNNPQCKKGPNRCFIRTDGEHCYIKPQLLLYWASALKEKASGVTVRRPPLIPDFERSASRAHSIPAVSSPSLPSSSSTILPPAPQFSYPSALPPNPYSFTPPHSHYLSNFPFPQYNPYTSPMANFSYNMPSQISPQSFMAYTAPKPFAHSSSPSETAGPTTEQIEVCRMATISEFLKHAKEVDSRYNFPAFVSAFEEGRVLPDILPMISDEHLELLCGKNLGATIAIRKMVGRVKL